MNKISSIRWSDPALFESAQAYVALHDEKMNTLIMNAISKYLQDRVPPVSKLRAQTSAFSETVDAEMKEWLQGQDTRGWE